MKEDEPSSEKNAKHITRHIIMQYVACLYGGREKQDRYALRG